MITIKIQDTGSDRYTYTAPLYVNDCEPWLNTSFD